MSVETYTTMITRLYMGLFFVSVLMSIVGIWHRIRKKTLKHWWMIPYSIIYPIFAVCSTITAYIAYDDPSDPNFRTYKNWELRDFAFNDLKMLVIWLAVGVLLYLIFRKRNPVKKRWAVSFVLFMILLAVMIALSIIKLS